MKIEDLREFITTSEQVSLGREGRRLVYDELQKPKGERLLFRHTRISPEDLTTLAKVLSIKDDKQSQGPFKVASLLHDYGVRHREGEGALPLSEPEMKLVMFAEERLNQFIYSGELADRLRTNDLENSRNLLANAAFMANAIAKVYASEHNIVEENQASRNFLDKIHDKTMDHLTTEYSPEKLFWGKALEFYNQAEKLGTDLFEFLRGAQSKQQYESDLREKYEESIKAIRGALSGMLNFIKKYRIYSERWEIGGARVENRLYPHLSRVLYHLKEYGEKGIETVMTMLETGEVRHLLQAVYKIKGKRVLEYRPSGTIYDSVKSELKKLEERSSQGIANSESFRSKREIREMKRSLQEFIKIFDHDIDLVWHPVPKLTKIERYPRGAIPALSASNSEVARQLRLSVWQLAVKTFRSNPAAFERVRYFARYRGRLQNALLKITHHRLQYGSPSMRPYFTKNILTAISWNLENDHTESLKLSNSLHVLLQKTRGEYYFKDPKNTTPGAEKFYTAHVGEGSENELSGFVVIAEALLHKSNGT